MDHTVVHFQHFYIFCAVLTVVHSWHSYLWMALVHSDLLSMFTALSGERTDLQMNGGCANPNLTRVFVFRLENYV